MYFKKFLAGILFVSFFSSCSESVKTQGELYFINNMDAIVGWKENANVANKGEKAHSGEYVSVIDGSNIYSLTFDLPLREVNNQYEKVSEVKITAWIYIFSDKAEASLVSEIRKNDSIIDWGSVKVKKFAEAPKKWFKVEKILKLNVNNFNDGDNHLRAYVVNDSKEEIFVDDFSVEFVR